MDMPPPFFARASHGSTRDPFAALAVQATTRGHRLSESCKTLERRGLIARTRSERDRRSVCFDLTEAGSAMLAQDPLRHLIGVIDALGASERDRFLTTLSRLGGPPSALATRRNMLAFGTCRDCSHFGTSGNTAYCACMAAELAAEETTKLCASYSGPTLVKKTRRKPRQCSLNNPKGPA